MPYRRLMLDNGAECQVWEIILNVTGSARSARASARVLCFLTGGEWRWLRAPPSEWACLPDVQLRTLWLRAEVALFADEALAKKGANTPEFGATAQGDTGLSRAPATRQLEITEP